MKQKKIAPRNHVIIASMKRGSSGAGSHRKSYKSERRADKVRLSKDW